jgi:cell division transport system permease protein
MAMKPKTLGYCLKQGIVGLFKNRLMSLASIGTISACILIVGIFYAVVANVEYMLEEVETKIGIVTFFDEGIEEDRILEIQEMIRSREDVYSVTYISADEAWESFQADYFEGREELLMGFENDNPLKDSASLQIFLADITTQGKLVDYIMSLEGVRMVREDREVTDLITSVSDFVKYISVILIAVLIIVSVFLISNTVRLAIELRKKEINIMKFIGATDAFIRGPFFVEGALIGAIGSLIPLGVIYYFYSDVIQSLLEKFSVIGDYLVFIPVNEFFVTLLPLSLAIGILIGVFGSMITIHKHLRV